jgi:hypothetical protein
MRFPVRFDRYLGTIPEGKTELGTDSVSNGTPPSKTMDNMLASRFQNINGWPCHRIAVCYTGPTGASALTARMYFYEDQTQAWYQIGAQVTMQLNSVSFFDVIALLEMPNTEANLENATPGSISQVLIVDAVGSTAGEYSFAIGPDLTTQA